MFSQITTNIQDALDRLITQYRGKSLITNLITAISAQFQIIEDQLINMNITRYLNMASGIQLDHIGSIVGISRVTGTPDAQYRLEIFGQIKINTSDGQPEQVIQTYQLFAQVMQVRLFELYPGEVIVESEYLPPDQASVNQIIKILGETLPAGVNVNGIVSYDSLVPFAYRLYVSPGSGYGTGKYAGIHRAKFPFGYGVNNKSIQGYGSVQDPLVGGSYSS